MSVGSPPTQIDIEGGDMTREIVRTDALAAAWFAGSSHGEGWARGQDRPLVHDREADRIAKAEANRRYGADIELVERYVDGFGGGIGLATRHVAG